MDTSRREFLRTSMAALGAACVGCPAFLTLPRSAGAVASQDDAQFVKEARYYKKLADLCVECELCPKACKVADLERGYCGVRENRGGTYYTLVHSRVCSVGPDDPIEKKPFSHYLPGTIAFSLATAGCNMECRYCQNWNISQYRPEQVQSQYLPPSAVAAAAKRFGAQTIAYTYSEPVIFYEYVYDCAVEARKHGLGNVIISNGYIKREPLVELCKVLSGVKIDFKGFTDKFYKEVCSGELQPVLDTLLTLRDAGIWYELVTLLIPTFNDSDQELQAMCAWIRKNLGPDVPIHFSRFHRMYKMLNLPSTPLKTLEKARKIALDAGLNYVYLGNVPGHEAESTYCPKCKDVLIKRYGYHIAANRLKDGACPGCKTRIPGFWSVGTPR